MDWLLQSFCPSIPVGVSVFTVTVFEERIGHGIKEGRTEGKGKKRDYI